MSGASPWIPRADAALAMLAGRRWALSACKNIKDAESKEGDEGYDGNSDEVIATRIDAESGLPIVRADRIQSGAPEIGCPIEQFIQRCENRRGSKSKAALALSSGLREWCAIPGSALGESRPDFDGVELGKRGVHRCRQHRLCIFAAVLTGGGGWRVS